MKVLVPDLVHPDKLDLPAGVEVRVYDPATPLPDEDADADVLVTFTFGPQHLASARAKLKNLKLIQGLSAGMDHMKEAGFGPEVAICSGVGLHDVTVSEHALTLALTLVRRIPQSLAAQAESRWAPELGGNQPLYPDGPVTTLLNADVLIWGFGSIAKHLAPILTSLGARVRGVARTAGQRSGYEVITEDSLADALPTTDLLIMILPSTEATNKILNAERFKQLSKDAYVVNVGRGATVDEAALLHALATGEIAGAAIDVTAVEPLPPGSPLWSAPNLVITPHAAGGRPVESEKLISRQVRALLGEGELINRVDA